MRDDAAHFDLFQFQNRQSKPVEAHATADGIESTSLSFGDYAAMQVHTKTLFAGRNTTPPCWATDMHKLGLLLARYFELRAGIHNPRIDSPERRVVHAQTKILVDQPARIATLDKLSAEYVALKNSGRDPDRLRVLEREIRSLDGRLVSDQRGPALVVGTIHYFFRCGYNSAQTADALNHLVSPVGVRQIASRLTALWKRMQDGTDHKPTRDELRKAKRRTWWALSGYKHVQATREKAERAAETPAQRAALLTYAREYYYKNHARIRAQQKANLRKRYDAMLRYRSLTPEQIEERRRKAREYNAKNREKRNADQRRCYARRVANMTPEQKAILHENQRLWRETHKEQRRAVEARMRAKKKAAALL